jgi:adenylate cyclase
VTEEGVKRKLTAIFSADAKGYSRLMGEDEVGTVQVLKEYREIMANFIQTHRGRVVDSPGDNILAEFGSIVDATECAVRIQKKLQTKNAELSEDKRLEFRIGINHGDVLEDEDRIYGDGVSIAARIEGLAPPGGICISRTTYDQIKNRLNLGYEYLGDHSVKNIAEPVRVYRVLTEPEAAGKVIGEKRFLGRISRKTAMVAIIVLVIVAGGLIGWNIYLQQSKRVEAASLDKMAYPLPDKPSIAVLPFDNLSGDPEQEYFSDGLTEEIITALSKTPKMLVIARNSTFTYKGKPVKIKQVAEELGVRYVMEGSVRTAGDQIRITAQLIDALTGHHLWAERYDRKLKDLFAIQDDISKKVITGELARVLEKGTDNIQAYLKNLQAYEYMHRVTKEDNAVARQLCQEAIALDPKYPGPHIRLALTHMWDGRFGWTKSPKESMARGFELAQKAFALDDKSSLAHITKAFVYLYKRQHEKAIDEAKQAIEVNPNFANAYGTLGVYLNYAGRPEEAIQPLKKAFRLNPMPPEFYFYHLGFAYLMTGRYEKAIAEYEKPLHRNPDNLFSHLYLAATYSLAGRGEEAQSAAKEVLRINPKLSVEKFIKRSPLKNKADADLLIDSLRKAGLK